MTIPDNDSGEKVQPSPLSVNRKPEFADTIAGRLLLGSVLPLCLVLAWWAGIRSGTAVVPTFGQVAYVLIHPFEQPQDIYSRSLAFSTMITIIRLMLGFGLGVITAVPLGLLLFRCGP